MLNEFEAPRMSEPNLQAGTAVEMDERFLRVRLEDGREISTPIPRDRKFGCLFGSLIGYNVTVLMKQPSKMPRVVSQSRPVK